MSKFYNSKVKWQKWYWIVSFFLLFVFIGIAIVANLSSGFSDMLLGFISLSILGLIIILIIYLFTLGLAKLYSIGNLSPAKATDKKDVEFNEINIKSSAISQSKPLEKSFIPPTKKFTTKHSAKKSPELLVATPALKPPVKSKQYKSHKKLIFGIIIIFCFLFAWGPLSDFGHFAIGSTFSDEKIKDIASNTGFNYAGKVLFFKANPELVTADTLNSHCPNNSESAIEFGCFDPNNNKIYLLEVSNSDYKDIEYSTAAHEVLHYAIRNLDDSELATVKSNLLKFYNDPANAGAVKLHEIMKSYPTDEPTVLDELHSFVGSGVEIQYIPLELKNYYKTYFDNISMPVFYSLSFDQKLDAKEASIEAKRAELNSQLAANNAYKVEWLDKIEAYLPSNLYYGDIARYNQNVNAYNANLKIYRTKIDAYNSAVDSFNSDINAYNAFLATFRPGSQNIPAISK